ncbi:hypothetical protein H4582DRAFT_2063279 [Lactarius indigo]|nr:hypothetical protein H4582DRAFT_2063279 [Lactarius indigo]
MTEKWDSGAGPEACKYRPYPTPQWPLPKCTITGSGIDHDNLSRGPAARASSSSLNSETHDAITVQKFTSIPYSPPLFSRQLLATCVITRVSLLHVATTTSGYRIDEELVPCIRRKTASGQRLLLRSSKQPGKRENGAREKPVLTSLIDSVILTQYVRRATLTREPTVHVSSSHPTDLTNKPPAANLLKKRVGDESVCRDGDAVKYRPRLAPAASGYALPKKGRGCRRKSIKGETTKPPRVIGVAEADAIRRQAVASMHSQDNGGVGVAAALRNSGQWIEKRDSGHFLLLLSLSNT